MQSLAISWKGRQAMTVSKLRLSRLFKFQCCSQLVILTLQAGLPPEDCEAIRSRLLEISSHSVRLPCRRTMQLHPFPLRQLLVYQEHYLAGNMVLKFVGFAAIHQQYQ